MQTTYFKKISLIALTLTSGYFCVSEVALKVLRRAGGNQNALWQLKTIQNPIQEIVSPLTERNKTKKVCVCWGGGGGTNKDKWSKLCVDWIKKQRIKNTEGIEEY